MTDWNTLIKRLDIKNIMFNYVLISLSIFFLLGSSDIFGWIHLGFYRYSLYISAWHYLTSALLSIPYFIIHNYSLKNFYFIVIILFCTIWNLIDMTCFVEFGTAFNAYYAELIIASSPLESSDFISTYISEKLIYLYLLVIILFIFILYAIYKLKRKSIRIKIVRQTVLIYFVMLIISLLVVIHNYASYKNSVFGKIEMFANVPKLPNLKDYPHDIHIQVNNNKVDNIVLILGESYNKGHSSIYGYNKKTTPRLEKLLHSNDGDELIVFNNVTAPALTTIPSIKCILSTYEGDDKDKRNWWDCDNIIEIMKLAGYNTYWFSNQGQKGIADNVATRYSELCDSAKFTGGGVRKRVYDGEILNFLKDFKQKRMGGGETISL